MDVQKTLGKIDDLELTDSVAICDLHERAKGGFDVTELKSLSSLLSTYRTALEEVREGLRRWAHECSVCGYFDWQHNEKGQVDTLDVFGHWSCGDPNFPAKDALSKIESALGKTK